MTTPADTLFQRPAPHQQTRWITYENTKGEKGAAGQVNHGRKGSPARILQPGETFVFVDVDGPGTIRRIWSTISRREPEALRGMRLEMYWDNAQTPAVQAPIGDFFGHPLGRLVQFDSACFSSPEGRSFNCTIPMPFRKHAKIQIVNETEHEVMFFYECDLTVGDQHNDDTLYFHAYWRRENPTELRRDMAILPHIEGCGRFLGCVLGVRQNPDFSTFWWGEGEVKVYLDGDKDLPTLCGTGTEDYIGTGWGQDVYDNLYQGCHYVPKEGNHAVKNAYGFYRFHVPDPVYFHKDICVTIQTIGCSTGAAALECLDANPAVKFMKTGDGTEYYTREELEGMRETYFLFERQDDHSAMAYWYLDRPENGLPPMQPLAERIADLKW